MIAELADRAVYPPIKIFPSGCTASDDTEPPVAGINRMSSVPSGLSRAMPLRGYPLRLLKKPPTRISPVRLHGQRSHPSVRTRVEAVQPALPEHERSKGVRKAR
jgi:hypothetical protein